MKQFVLALISFATVLSLTACGGTENPPSSESSSLSSESQSSSMASEYSSSAASSTTVSNEDAAKNIEVRAEPTEEGSYCVFITNNNPFSIPELDVQIQYMDAENKIVDLNHDGHDAILPGYTVVSRLNAPDTGAFDHVETQITIDMDHTLYNNHSENVKIDAHPGVENTVIIEITNNGTVDIEEVEYVVVYYNGDKISSVGYCRDVRDVGAGKTMVEKESTYNVEYDRYEVYLNQAHTFE